MLLTVTPNLCVERTVTISDFSVGKVHRVEPENLRVNAGGKGINAARAALQLGAGVLALSWVGKNQRAWFEKELAREGIPHQLIETQSDTRVCLNILRGEGNKGDSLKTEVVEAGTPLGFCDGEAMLERFDALLPSCELAAICGSYPPSTPADCLTDFPSDHLTQMSELSRKHGKKLLVDSKGAAFKTLLQSAHLPWAIKPNCDEAAAFLEYSVEDEASEKRAVEDFLKLGIEVVLLSCGARGAYLGTRAGTYFLTPPRVREVSAVGAGDAFAGAFAATYLQCGDVAQAARWGAAAGAACASGVLSFCAREEIEALVPQVEVRKI